MTDYMKGYTRRNRKRRMAHSKRYKQTSYRKRRILSAARLRRPAILYHWGSRLVLGALVFFIAIYVCIPKNGRGTAPAATGGGVSATAVFANVPVSAAAVTVTPAPTPVPRPKAVAFTFDDGPNKDVTPRILTVLKKYNVHATFFVVGNRVPSGVSAIQQAVAQGCEIGNHSWEHANLAKWKIKKVRNSYNKTVKIVKKHTGFNVKFLRPPYGAISQTMRKKLKHPMVLWNVDTEDWKSRDGRKVFKEIKRSATDGSIILMHDLYPSTVDAIEKAIPWLLAHDYDVLTVSELMERKGVTMKNGIAYGSAG